VRDSSGVNSSGGFSHDPEWMESESTQKSIGDKGQEFKKEQIGWFSLLMMMSS